MRISFVGSGRVATHLAKVLSNTHEIVQILSQQLCNAEKLAKMVNAQGINQYSLLDKNIDLLVISVSDASIEKVILQLANHLENVMIVHTSGSTHLDILSQHHLKSGVFYPLQTFSVERSINWENTPIFVETTQQSDLNQLTQLANSLSKKVYQYSSEQRQSLHLAAIFASNFSNYCYDMAKQIVDSKNVDFNLLHPLILETAEKATQNDPQLMQTGPAKRGDQQILDKHQQILQNDQREDLKRIYELLSQGIMQKSNTE